MYQSHQSAPKSYGHEMDLKRADGLQNLLNALDMAEHKYWPEHGVSEHRAHNDNLQAAQGISRYSPSATIHCQCESTNRSLPRYPELQVSPYLHRFDSSLHPRPAQPSPKAKMVELSKMDSKALIAAALAPNTDFPNLGDNGYSSKRLPDTNNPVQKVSPSSVVQSY